MTIKKLFLSLLLTAMTFVPFTTNAQITIGSGRAPSEWSLLDLCTNVERKALHLPRLYNSETHVDLDLKNLLPDEQTEAGGLMIFNTYNNCLEFWNGRDWISLCDDRAQLASLPTAPIENGFVGAFWRDNQTEERLIRMNHAGNWTAVAMDDWIVLDRYYVPFSHSAVNPPASLPANARGRVNGRGDIYFRIGLTAPNPNAGQPRYGRVIVTHNNNTQSHTIWIRQGEAADYLMRPTDLMDNGQQRPAVRFSPFNLTVPSINNHPYGRPNTTLLNTQIPVQGGGGFVQYPTQTGAFWQWAGSTAVSAAAAIATEPQAPDAARIAWHPTDPPGIPMNPRWNNRNMLGTWANLAANHETCPPGYRRPRDGDIAATTVTNRTAAQILVSEMRQSLFLNPQFVDNTVQPQSMDNVVVGFYADGFFDRRERVIPTSLNVSGVVPSATTVADGTPDIANRGLLFFNPTTNASLFFPASGIRNRNAGTPSATGGGPVYGVGQWAWYWSATPGDQETLNTNTRAWRMEFRYPATLNMDGGNPRSHGFPIRCVRE